jgi:hypothetical protein
MNPFVPRPEEKEDKSMVIPRSGSALIAAQQTRRKRGTRHIQ